MARKMHADGEHITAIADVLSVARSTVYRALGRSRISLIPTSAPTCAVAGSMCAPLLRVRARRVHCGPD